MQELTAQELACLCLPLSSVTVPSLTSPLPSLTSLLCPISSAFTDPVCFNANNTSTSDLTIKFDTACSHNMSGNSDRLFNTMPTTIRVKGFNDTSSPAATLGLNSDSRPELFIPNMPSDLVLLCAADYTQQGATILLPNEGFVLALSPDEQEFLRTYASDKPIMKQLIVQNNTYEVVDKTSSPSLATPSLQQALASSTATRYFNSKINVSTVEERILATLLSGLTFKDLLTMTKNESVLGMPRDITPQSLHSFENKYGRTPDILQLAFPDLSGNKKGYFAPKEPTTHCGQHIEADFFEAEFNDIPYTDTPEPSPPPTVNPKKVKKLPSFGGATAGYVYLDVHSGYVNGILVTSMKNPLPLVQATIKAQTNRGYVPSVFAADQGIISQSLFRVSIPTVQKFLREHTPPITPQCGEAYNHNNGTPHIEHVIRQIKELIRFAILYLLRNPNFASFHFTRKQCLRLWGELFYWAIMIINLKPSYSNPSITRYEHYLTIKPDLRAIRLLPIFSSLYVLRRAEHAELNSQHHFWQFGLYVGPSPSVPGAIRAAVRTNDENVHIITTSAIKGVSDGGQVSIYPTADTSINCLYEKDNAIHDPLAVAHIQEPTTTPPAPAVVPHLDPPAVVPHLDPGAVVPTLTPAPTAASPTVDPVNNKDPVFQSSPTTSVEHQSTLPPMQESSSDSRIGSMVHSASDPVPPESSHPQHPLTLPMLHPPRGSRRKQSPVPSLPSDPTTSSRNHSYNTRKKHNPLPAALNATTFQPLPSHCRRPFRLLRLSYRATTLI